MADLAFTFHFQPSEMGRMTWPDIMEWHAQAARINGRSA
jgi:hypothetical protein